MNEAIYNVLTPEQKKRVDEQLQRQLAEKRRKTVKKLNNEKYVNGAGS